MAKLTAYNVIIACLAAIGGFSYGFGFSVFATSIGMPGFFEYFKLDPHSTYTANILGAVNGVFNFGLAVGSITQGWLSDVLGRKPTFALAAVCALVGGALVAGSVKITMLIVVRLLQGFGLGILLSVVPLYLTEVAPAHRRGLVSGLTTLSFTLGYLVAAWLGVGAYYAKNTVLQWRLPLALSCLGPLLLLVGLPFIPESPRYLAQVGKNDEAWEVMKRIHHDPNDPQDSACRAEYTQIVRQVEFEGQQCVSYVKMFTNPSLRRRSLLAFFIQFASQSSGILAIANFMIIVFGNLGMTGVMPLVLYAVANCFGTISVTFGTMMLDRVGRRPMFLIGFPCLAIILLIEALLQWKYVGSGNKTGLGACVAVLYLYFIVFCACIDVTQFVWVAEIFPTAARSRGVGIGFFGYFVGAITYTTASALEMKNIKHNIFYLYMGLCIISTIVIYFFVPETKQLPMEEIAALFGDEVVVYLSPDGQNIIEEREIGKDGAGSVKHSEIV